MLVVGLTGSIGMGKSTVAGMLRARGIAVFDADAEVHRLYASEAVPLIEAAFPGTTADDQVDRTKLAAALAGDADRFRTLERIVHPLVAEAERRFLRQAHDRGDPAPSGSRPAFACRRRNRRLRTRASSTGSRAGAARHVGRAP